MSPRKARSENQINRAYDVIVFHPEDVFRFAQEVTFSAEEEVSSIPPSSSFAVVLD